MIMKKILFALMTAISAFSFSACSSGSDDINNANNNGNNNDDNQETVVNPETPADSSKILVVYFSWGGNTRTVASQIAQLTGGTLYEIQPATPYTTDYTELAYTVARNELDTNARPALKETDADFSQYDYVFLGCPVWWQTAPMIMSTFCETYSFEGKTVIPFCTYASAGRDATLQKLNELTAAASHLTGFGTTGSNTNGVESWLKEINMIK